MEREEEQDLQEHWRLLYVGLTRAIERLVVAGVQPSGERVENCWHMRVERALLALGAMPEPDARWGQVLRYSGFVPGKRVAPKDAKPDLPKLGVPEWAGRAAPLESRPPRPLAPSAITQDHEASEPPSAAMKAAARRGTLIHQLFERLPDVAPELRIERAIAWLQRSGGVMERDEAASIAEQVCAIMSDTRYAALFASGSLGEAPIAATLPDGRVLAGTIDRLLVEPDRVSVIDFKTGRVPPSEAAIPAAHRRQMEAYAEALRVIFPDREVRAALLYTAEARLFELAA
jgi:ATP-dependent helicase/nuclease subunit A